MKRSTRGFYTVEAAIFLPLLILAILSLGYFMRVEGCWENCMHGAIDECSLSASKAYGKDNASAGKAIESRLTADNPKLDRVDVKRLIPAHVMDVNMRAYSVEASTELRLPLGFSRELSFSSRIEYRNFCGRRTEAVPLGDEGLEREQDERPVCIFPAFGRKYHGRDCTYVKAAVEKRVLTGKLRRRYSACGLCRSGTLADGSIVFCFNGEDTAYHRGSCRAINRHTIVIDESEARERGYIPCSKCGGR